MVKKHKKGKVTRKMAKKAVKDLMKNKKGVGVTERKIYKPNHKYMLTKKELKKAMQKLDKAIKNFPVRQKSKKSTACGHSGCGGGAT